MASVCLVLLLPAGIVGAQEAPPVAAAVVVQPQGCLHGEGETALEARRRDEALAAMRLIYLVLERSGPKPGAVFPSWESFADSALVMGVQRADGPAGELARRIRWGAGEPLPGWGIAYVATPLDVRFALTDLRDPCGFTYSSVDPDVIPRRRGRIVPLG